MPLLERSDLNNQYSPMKLLDWMERDSKKPSSRFGLSKLQAMMQLMFLGVIGMQRGVAALSSAAAAGTTTKRIAIIGGGASGIFAAISAAEHYASRLDHKREFLQVVVLEATSKTLTKVGISGGGRCNGKLEPSAAALEDT